MKGQEIAKTAQIKKAKDGWIVPSQTTGAKYFVNEEFVCTCPDSEFHKTTCKHAYAVRYYLQKEIQTQQGIKTERMRLTYHQAWGAYNKAQTEEIGLFDKLLKDLVGGIEEPDYQFGRPSLSLKEQAFCSIQKVYSQLSSRRAVSLFGRAKDNGLLDHKPHFNSVSKFLNSEEATPILMGLLTLSAIPLKGVESDFAVDSTGFRTTSFGMYASAKYGLKRQHKWIKAHACVGVKTNVITAVAITDENGGDCPQFTPLIQATANNGFTIEEVSADKAYSSRDNYAYIERIGGTAYIPFRSNASGKPRGKGYIWRKMFHYFQLNQEEFMEHYHKRSNIESAFASIKKKFGDALKSKNYTAQVNELLCKIIAYNVVVLIHEMEELKIKPDFCTQSQGGEFKVGQ